MRVPVTSRDAVRPGVLRRGRVPMISSIVVRTACIGVDSYFATIPAAHRRMLRDGTDLTCQVPSLVDAIMSLEEGRVVRIGSSDDPMKWASYRLEPLSD